MSARSARKCLRERVKATAIVVFLSVSVVVGCDGGGDTAERRRIDAWEKSWRVLVGCMVGEPPLSVDPQAALAFRRLSLREGEGALTRCQTHAAKLELQTRAGGKSWAALATQVGLLEGWLRDPSTGTASVGMWLEDAATIFDRLRSYAGLEPAARPWATGPPVNQQPPEGRSMRIPDERTRHGHRYWATRWYHDAGGLVLREVRISGSQVGIVRGPQRIEWHKEAVAGNLGDEPWAAWTEDGEGIRRLHVGPVDADGTARGASKVIWERPLPVPTVPYTPQWGELVAIGDGGHRIVVHIDDPLPDGRVVILRSVDGGRTWREDPVTSTQAVLRISPGTRSADVTWLGDAGRVYWLPLRLPVTADMAPRVLEGALRPPGTRYCVGTRWVWWAGEDEAFRVSVSGPPHAERLPDPVGRSIAGHAFMGCDNEQVVLGDVPTAFEEMREPDRDVIAICTRAACTPGPGIAGLQLPPIAGRFTGAALRDGHLLVWRADTAAPGAWTARQIYPVTDWRTWRLLELVVFDGIIHALAHVGAETWLVSLGPVD